MKRLHGFNAGERKQNWNLYNIRIKSMQKSVAGTSPVMLQLCSLPHIFPQEGLITEGKHLSQGHNSGWINRLSVYSCLFGMLNFSIFRYSVFRSKPSSLAAFALLPPVFSSACRIFCVSSPSSCLCTRGLTIEEV